MTNEIKLILPWILCKYGWFGSYGRKLRCFDFPDALESLACRSQFSSFYSIRNHTIGHIDGHDYIDSASDAD